jgi:hypothetical protein
VITVGVAESCEAWVMVVVVLLACAPGHDHRKQFTEVHSIVTFIMVATVSVRTRVRPIILNHVDPEREDPHPYPEHDRKREATCKEPQEIKAECLSYDRIEGTFHDPKCPGSEDLVGCYVLLALIRKPSLDSLFGSPS